MKVFPTTLNACGEGLHDIGRRVTKKLMLHSEGFEITETLSEADCVFAGTPIMDPWRFNWTLASSIMRHDKPVIMFNESDGGPPWTDDIPFSEYVLHPDSGIKAYFYREWFKGKTYPELSFPLITFDLCGYHDESEDKDRWMVGAQSRKEFDARPMDVFMCQSIHVKSRKAMFETITSKKDPKWVASDYYRVRLPFDLMMNMQRDSKITLVLEGSGIKCMRHYEAGINSVMAMPSIEMEETYPWISGRNCLRLPYKDHDGEWDRTMVDPTEAISYLEGYVSDTPVIPLYEIYRNGVENAACYSMPNYIRNHIAPTILQYV